MGSGKIKLILSVFLLTLYSVVASQTVPLGVHYQAVARDNYGKELSNREIDVRFSIIYGNPLGTVVYQEIHEKVRTSYYGVFTLVIGKGVQTSGTKSSLGEVAWETGNHYIKVEVKFDNDYMDMGTMQFLAVPYALYAKKSLEPGPQGPQGPQGLAGPKGDTGLKGDPGDPATDDQVLSFNGSSLSISGGNTVSLASLNLPHSMTLFSDTIMLWEGNRPISKVELPSQIQDLSIDGSNRLNLSKSSVPSVDLTRFLDNTDNQSLSFNSSTSLLTISGGNSVDLSLIKQDLNLAGNILTITNKPSPNQIDLSKYNQTLTFNSADNTLSILNGNSVNLTALKDDADASPTNEIQSLIYDKVSGNLSVTPGSSTVNLHNIVGFKAKKTTNQTGLTLGTTYPFIPSDFVEFNEGDRFNTGNGTFTAPTPGIYTFFITYRADGAGSSRVLSLLKNGEVYEILGPDISSGTELAKWVTMKLNQGEYVSLTINTGMSTYSGTGSFTGFLSN